MENLSAEQRDSLCKKIDGLARHGELVDWGYAVPLPPPSTPVDNSLFGNGPPTLPIEPEGDSDMAGDYVPVVNIHDLASRLISVSELSALNEIVLLMAPSDLAEDPHHMIDASPLHRTVHIPLIDVCVVLMTKNRVLGRGCPQSLSWQALDSP